jgi:hypothetical protein
VEAEPSTRLVVHGGEGTEMPLLLSAISVFPCFYTYPEYIVPTIMTNMVEIREDELAANMEVHKWAGWKRNASESGIFCPRSAPPDE